MRERLESTREYFETVAGVEPRVRALFGDEPADALRQTLKTRNLVAASWGMHCNWQEGGPTPSQSVIEKIEKTIWEGYGDPDEVKQDLDSAVAIVRKHLEPFVRTRARQ